jgi:hypothetical protein
MVSRRLNAAEVLVVLEGREEVDTHLGRRRLAGEGRVVITPGAKVQGVSWSAISGGSIVLEARQGTQTRSRE